MLPLDASGVGKLRLIRHIDGRDIIDSNDFWPHGM